MSDTALMVAGARALESARPNGLIHDPYAAKLAGDRGMAIVSGRGQEWMRIGISMRTHLMDEFVRETITNHGINTVVNLGAGLDTRPWRMDLPGALRWIEVDFEPILQYKLEALGNEKPKCSHRAVYADLASTEGRRLAFEVVGHQPALMITEGLLMYLPADAVRALGTEAPLRSGICRWLFDIATVQLMRVAHSQDLDEIEKVRAEGHLTGVEITDVVHGAGWQLVQHASYIQETAKLKERLGPISETLADVPEPPKDDPSGVYLFAR